MQRTLWQRVTRWSTSDTLCRCGRPCLVMGHQCCNAAAGVSSWRPWVASLDCLGPCTLTTETSSTLMQRLGLDRTSWALCLLVREPNEKIRKGPPWIVKACSWVYDISLVLCFCREKRLINKMIKSRHGPALRPRLASSLGTRMLCSTSRFRVGKGESGLFKRWQYFDAPPYAIIRSMLRAINYYQVMLRK